MEGEEKTESRGETAGPPPQVGAAPAVPGPGDFHRLAPEHVIVETLVSRIVATVLSLGAVVSLTALYATRELAIGWWIALGAAALLLVVGLWVLAQVWPPIEHRHAGYRVGAEAIELEKGVVWRSLASVPRARIQHTDVAQGPLQRSYDLATLVIYTAGTSYSKLELAGLRHADALRIRDELLRTSAAPETDGGEAIEQDARQQLLAFAEERPAPDPPPAS